MVDQNLNKLLEKLDDKKFFEFTSQLMKNTDLSQNLEKIVEDFRKERLEKRKNKAGK